MTINIRKVLYQLAWPCGTLQRVQLLCKVHLQQGQLTWASTGKSKITLLPHTFAWATQGVQGSQGGQGGQIIQGASQGVQAN